MKLQMPMQEYAGRTNGLRRLLNPWRATWLLAACVLLVPCTPSRAARKEPPPSFFEIIDEPIEDLLGSPMENFERIMKLHLTHGRANRRAADIINYSVGDAVDIIRETLNEDAPPGQTAEDRMALRILLAEGLRTCDMNSMHSSPLVRRKYAGRDWKAGLRGVVGELVEDYARLAGNPSRPRLDWLRGKLVSVINSILVNPCARTLDDKTRKVVMEKYIRDKAEPLSVCSPQTAVAICRNLGADRELERMLSATPYGAAALVRRMQMARAAGMAGVAIETADTMLESLEPEMLARHMDAIVETYVELQPDVAVAKFSNDWRCGYRALALLYLADLGRADGVEADAIRAKWLLAFMRRRMERSRMDDLEMRRRLLLEFKSLATVLFMGKDYEGALYVGTFIVDTMEFAAVRELLDVVFLMSKCLKSLGRPGQIADMYRKCLAYENLDEVARDKIRVALETMESNKDDMR